MSSLVGGFYLDHTVPSQNRGSHQFDLKNRVPTSLCFQLEQCLTRKSHANPKAKPLTLSAWSHFSKSQGFPSEHHESWRRPCLLTSCSEAHESRCYMKKAIGNIGLNTGGGGGQRAHSKPDAGEPRSVGSGPSIYCRQPREGRLVTVVLLLSGSRSLQPALFLSSLPTSPHFCRWW